MTRSGPPPGLLRHKGFRRLWAAQTMSVLGAQISELALPLAAVAVLKATAFQVGLLAAVQYLPFLLIGLPAGAWVDRTRRRPVMVVADLVRFGVLLTVPTVALCGGLRLWLLYPVGFVVGVMTVFFDLAAQSFLPTLVGEVQLVEANTRLQLSQTAGQLAGPSAGGFLVQLLTAPVAVAADALSYAGSAVMLLLVRVEEHPIREAARQGMVAEVKEGLSHVFRHPLLRPITLSAGITNLFGLFGMVQAIQVLYAVRDLRLSPAGLGVALAIANAGVLLGSLANGPVVRRFGLGPTLTWSVFGMGGAILLLPLATPGTAMLVLTVAMALAGVCACVFNINQMSLRQAVTPAPMRGRMTATLRFVVWGVIPVGTFLGGMLAGPLGLRGVLCLAGVGSVLAGLPLLFSSVRSQRTMPDATPIARPTGQEALHA